MYQRSAHATLAVFLQNDAGFSKWEPTDERIQAMLDAYKPSTHDREGAKDDKDNKYSPDKGNNTKEKEENTQASSS